MVLYAEKNCASPGADLQVIFAVLDDGILALGQKTLVETTYWSKYIGNCMVHVTENMDGEYGIPDLFVPLRCDHNN